MKNFKLLLLVMVIAIVASGCGIGLNLVLSTNPASPIYLDELEDDTITLTVQVKGFGLFTIDGIDVVWEPVEGEEVAVEVEGTFPLKVPAAFGLVRRDFNIDMSDITTEGTLTISIEGTKDASLEVEIAPTAPAAEEE